MKSKLHAVILAFLMVTPVLLNCGSSVNAQTTATTDIFVGIDVAYGDIAAIKSLVDEISAYTNLFIIGCTAISQNAARLNDMCQYLYERDLSFIVYQEWPLEYRFRQAVVSNWTETAKNRWGDKFWNMLPR